MILILSKSKGESTTEMVMDWIEDLGGQCVRLNGDDIAGAAPYEMILEPETGRKTEIELGEKKVRPSEIGAVWYRRWRNHRRDADRAGFPERSVLAYQVDDHLRSEVKAAKNALFARLGHARWLSHPETSSTNKPEILRQAHEKAGLRVPATIVTSRKESLKAFKQRHGTVVTKAISDGGPFFRGRERVFSVYTEVVEEEAIEAIPDVFFPVLVQEHIEKRYDVRVFYLDGKCWSMAIFSQRREESKVDFRRYDWKQPDRNVPYRLPGKTEDKIQTLMQKVGLKTGSIDLAVEQESGAHVFLEVNPVGQLGMVSHPCNYPLEKEIAKYLIKIDYLENGSLEGGSSVKT